MEEVECYGTIVSRLNLLYMKEGSGQPTVLAFVKSLARFLATLVGENC